MRYVDENQFSSYTISRNGSNVTFCQLATVLPVWRSFGSGSVLYGNKPDGTRAILDSK